MEQRFLRILQFTGCLAAGILLLFIAFRGMDLEQLADQFRQADYRWVWLSLVFGVCSHIFRACRWRLMCGPLGHKPTVFRTLCAVMTGYLTNFAFPRAGEVARCAVLTRTDRLPFEKLLGTVVAERAVDLLCVLLMLAALLVFRFGFFGDFIQRELFAPTAQYLSAHATVLRWTAVGLVLLTAAVVLLLRKGRHHFADRVRHILQGLWEGLVSIFHMERRGAFVAFTILLWIAYFLQTYVVFFAVPATAGLSPVDGIFILVMCSLGFVVPVQGGIGAYHWIVSLSLMLYGIARADGLVYATIAHTSGSLLTIVMGFAALVCLGFIRKNKPEQASLS